MVVSSRWEPLNHITQAECVLEGFPHLTPDEFVHMLTAQNHFPANIPVNRIEFKYVEDFYSLIPYIRHIQMRLGSKVKFFLYSPLDWNKGPLYKELSIYFEEQQKRQQAFNELKDDLIPIANQMIKITIDSVTHIKEDWLDSPMTNFTGIMKIQLFRTNG